MKKKKAEQKKESDKGQESKEIKRAKRLKSRRIKEDRGASLFPHQIIDFALSHSAPHIFLPADFTSTQPVF